MQNATGINSGPMPPENDMMKVFTILINDTKPLWMYCAIGNHCQQGMVMAINAPSEGEKTLQNYKALAVDSSAGAAANGTAQGPSGGASSVIGPMVGATAVATALFAGFALLL